MQAAVKHAGRDSGDVEAVWSASFGAPVLDRAEERAIRPALPNNVEVFAPKRLLGEPLGSGGPLNVALALHRWQGASVDRRGLALVNSSSLGGVHISIALDRGGVS